MPSESLLTLFGKNAMMFESLFTQFYCLPMWFILELFMVATGMFLWLKNAFQSHWLWKVLLFIVFIGFSSVILYLTVSTRESASSSEVYILPFHSYREVLNGGNPEILRSNFMNVVLFYPSGLLMASLLPRKWPWWIRILLTFILFTGLSVGVEYVQYSQEMGRAEIDDVIHNSLGALLGSICSLIPLPSKKSSFSP